MYPFMSSYYMYGTKETERNTIKCFCTKGAMDNRSKCFLFGTYRETL